MNLTTMIDHFCVFIDIYKYDTLSKIYKTSTSELYHFPVAKLEKVGHALRAPAI